MEYWSPNRDAPYIDGLPLIKPPYGRIVAIDLNRGEHVWTAVNGDGPRNHPLLKDLNLPPLGTASRPTALVTKTLLFIGDGSNTFGGIHPSMWGKRFRAYDKAHGQGDLGNRAACGHDRRPDDLSRQRKAIHRRPHRWKG